ASAGIIAFVSIGKMLEERAKDNTTTAITKLMGLQPQDVTRIADNGEMQVVPISSVVEGDLLMVRAGERIAVDGVVNSGESYVDESMLTGEHMPVRKYEGSSVYAGTLNGKGVLYYKVLKTGDSTLLSQIIHFVQEAQGSKAPVQRLVDKVASIFVPVVFTIAVVAFVVWLLLGGEDAFSHAILAFVTILVIACPCALGLATPTAITVGMGRAAQQGILIKSAEALENTCRVTSVVLDKTGTITQGSPAVVHAHWCEETLAKQVLYDIESRSEHPLALAVIAMLDGRTAGEITQYESLPGYGVMACIGAERYYIGNDALMTLHGIALPDELTRMAESWTREACTIVWVAAVDRILALLAIADPLKETSEQAIKALKQAGLKVYMLTGDNHATAESIAHKVGIENVVAGVLPEQKAMYVKKLQQNGEVVAMIGDGINDSAALAQADVSIAMGHGSDIAMDVAAMTIISDDLNRIAQAIHLSQLTTTTIRQNLFWAFIYNVIGIPIAAGVLYPCCGFLLNPMIASAAMAMSSVCVVSNSLRLNKKK
ncbi:MAG: copper-translocating P-type ATPase, partial [Muribaculaceae bacterium]|nr:copper-translocating P-type ATPase [Muribaculaceae bacterium]